MRLRVEARLTIKVHMLADALGRPLRLIVTAAQVGGVAQAPALLDGQAGDAVLADKARDSDALRADAQDRHRTEMRVSRPHGQDFVAILTALPSVFISRSQGKQRLP